MTVVPKTGDVLLIDGRASVQFAGPRGFLFRVISVSGQPTYHGWAWVTGYVLDRAGLATGRREIFVQPAGLRRVSGPPPSPRRRRTCPEPG